MRIGGEKPKDAMEAHQLAKHYYHLARRQRMFGGDHVENMILAKKFFEQCKELKQTGDMSDDDSLQEVDIDNEIENFSEDTINEAIRVGTTAGADAIRKVDPDAHHHKSVGHEHIYIGAQPDRDTHTYHVHNSKSGKTHTVDLDHGGRDTYSHKEVHQAAKGNISRAAALHIHKDHKSEMSMHEDINEAGYQRPALQARARHIARKSSKLRGRESVSSKTTTRFKQRHGGKTVAARPGTKGVPRSTGATGDKRALGGQGAILQDLHNMPEDEFRRKHGKSKSAARTALRKEETNPSEWIYGESASPEQVAKWRIRSHVISKKIADSPLSKARAAVMKKKYPQATQKHSPTQTEQQTTSSIGTPLKHKPSWNPKTHKLIIRKKGGSVKVVPKSSPGMEAEGVANEMYRPGTPLTDRQKAAYQLRQRKLKMAKDPEGYLRKLGKKPVVGKTVQHGTSLSRYANREEAIVDESGMSRVALQKQSGEKGSGLKTFKKKTPPKEYGVEKERELAKKAGMYAGEGVVDEARPLYHPKGYKDPEVVKKVIAKRKSDITQKPKKMSGFKKGSKTSISAITSPEARAAAYAKFGHFKRTEEVDTSAAERERKRNREAIEAARKARAGPNPEWGFPKKTKNEEHAPEVVEYTSYAYDYNRRAWEDSLAEVYRYKGRSGHRVTQTSKTEPEHIIMQMRKVVSLGDAHQGVEFNDGTTKKVSTNHASKVIARHDAAKSSDDKLKVTNTAGHSHAGLQHAASGKKIDHTSPGGPKKPMFKAAARREPLRGVSHPGDE